MKRDGAQKLNAYTSRTSRRGRLRSLDVMRGLVITIMILVNFCMVGAGFRRFAIYPAMAHADWAGFTLADFVFPAFIFMVGISIALASRGSELSRAPNVRRILIRSARLFVVGFFLTNLLYQWRHGWSFDGGFRLMGVLQRISLCYLAAALLQSRRSERTLAAVATVILLLYWPLALLPIPDGTVSNLWMEGANFVSWFDRATLGSHRGVEGPMGYDPEGILSTLPAIAQCVLGVLTGRYILDKQIRDFRLFPFAIGGSVLAVVGCIWGVWFPIVKSIWSSSFVLLSTGLAMLVFAVAQGALSAGKLPDAVARFFEVFGVNAILAYVLHFLCYFGLALPFIPKLYRAIAAFATPALADLCIAFLFTLVVWCPLAVMYSRDSRVSI